MAITPTEYVVGFMFDTEGESVALIEKNRPSWQKGKLNGIGGHIEPGESPIDAMVREFREETGHDSSSFPWGKFATLSGDQYVVHFFTSIGPVRSLQTTTDERVSVYNKNCVTIDNAVPNLTYLLPLAALFLMSRQGHLKIEEA